MWRRRHRRLRWPQCGLDNNTQPPICTSSPVGYHTNGTQQRATHRRIPIALSPAGNLGLEFRHVMSQIGYIHIRSPISYLIAGPAQNIILQKQQNARLLF